MKTIVYATLLCCNMFFCGCFTDYDAINKQRRADYLASHSNIDSEIYNAILNGKLHLGMTKEQVIASWGKPYDINRTVYTFGVHEQWIYGAGVYYRYFLYFEDGILTSWQEL